MTFREDQYSGLIEDAPSLDAKRRTGAIFGEIDKPSGLLVRGAFALEDSRMRRFYRFIRDKIGRIVVSGVETIDVDANPKLMGEYGLGGVEELIDKANGSLAHQLLVVEALGAYPKDDQAFEYLIGLVRLDFATCGSGLVSDLVPLELNHVRNDEKFYVDLPHTKSGNPIYAGFDKGQSDTTPFERMQDGLFQGEIDALKRMPLDIVLAAIRSLAKHNTERAMRVLLYLAENHSHAEVQSVCKEALSSVQPLLLASMILERDAEGSELLFEMLMSCPNQVHVINMLFILADSDKTNVRCAAVSYLNGMAEVDKRIPPFLRRLAKSASDEVAKAANGPQGDMFAAE